MVDFSIVNACVLQYSTKAVFEIPIKLQQVGTCNFQVDINLLSIQFRSRKLTPNNIILYYEYLSTSIKSKAS